MPKLLKSSKTTKTMEFFWIFIGMLAVLSQIDADYVKEIQETKQHDMSNICTAEANWALWPHPHDCHKFFVCANHVPEVFKCERNYYFDILEKRCKSGTCKAVKQCQNWVRSVSDDCSAFEICQNGVYARYTCTENHYFDAELGMCKKIEHTPEHMCSCILPEHALLANLNNCETYYTCIHGNAVLQKCDLGAYFDKHRNTCIVDLTGSCLMTPTMDPQEYEMLGICEHLSMGAVDEIVFVPDTKNCNKFYMCLNGNVSAKKCPESFYYNREAKICEYDSNGICDAIREQAKKMKQQQEKEAYENVNTIKIETNYNEANAIFENPPPQSQVSLLYAHLNVEAGNDVVPNATPYKDTESIIETLHTDDLPNVAVLPKILNKPIKHSNVLKLDPEAFISDIENEHSLNKKLPLAEKLQTELKLPQMLLMTNCHQNLFLFKDEKNSFRELYKLEKKQNKSIIFKI